MPDVDADITKLEEDRYVHLYRCNLQFMDKASTDWYCDCQFSRNELVVLEGGATGSNAPTNERTPCIHIESVCVCVCVWCAYGVRMVCVWCACGVCVVWRVSRYVLVRVSERAFCMVGWYPF